MTNKNPSFKYEKFYRNKGFSNIVGLDEVGRGSFAGPLVAAAVILPWKFKINGIKDSKMLNPKTRSSLSRYIIDNALDYVISEVSVDYINSYGIGKATNKAFLSCLKKLKRKFDFVLVDGYKIRRFDQRKQTGVIHGDSISVSIAAASIIAKVYRDDLMIKLHTKYPNYDFLKNKGYGTKFHRDAIKKFGLSEVHRTSFNLKKFL